MTTQALENQRLINECILLRHLANSSCWLSTAKAIDDLTNQVFEVGPHLANPELV